MAVQKRKPPQGSSNQQAYGHENVPTADCVMKPTPSSEEGPFYKSGSPRRTNIADSGTFGDKLIVEGYVFDRHCRPIKNAWLDFWQADGRGLYDNVGFNLRGHQFTDNTGHYYLETIKPVRYGFRTAHIHVKLRANSSSPILTTQLFFPGEKGNRGDPIFESALLMKVVSSSGGKRSTFNFVLDID
jgi:protocatechuate 3,4-dioxygenase beta subunit